MLHGHITCGKPGKEIFPFYPQNLCRFSYMPKSNSFGFHHLKDVPHWSMRKETSVAFNPSILRAFENKSL
jgi:hypothetical protein